jgi:hypothetical protein
MAWTRRIATFRDSLHGQRKHTIIVGCAIRTRPPTRATIDLAGELFFDVVLVGDVARRHLGDLAFLDHL